MDSSNSKKPSIEFVDNIYALLIAILCNTNSDMAFRLYYNSKLRISGLKNYEGLSPSDCQYISRLYKKSVPVKEIASMFGLSDQTIYSNMRKYNNTTSGEGNVQ